MLSKRRNKAYFYLTVTSLIWGFAGPIIKYTLSGIPTIPFLTYRFAISSIAAIIGFKFIKVKKLKAKEWLIIIVYSLFASSFSLYFLFIGLERTTMLDTALITTFNPLLITIAGFLIFKDKITSREKIGIFLAFLGTSITIFQPLIENENKLQLQGNIFVVLYLAANTTASILAKKLTKLDIPPFFITNFSFIVGFFSLVIFSVYNGVNIPSAILNLEFKYNLGVWFMALISGNLAYTLWVKGQKSIEISEASLFSYLQPLFSTPLAILWLKEETNKTFFIGAFFILMGVIIAETKKKRNL